MSLGASLRASCSTGRRSRMSLDELPTRERSRVFPNDSAGTAPGRLVGVADRTCKGASRWLAPCTSESQRWSVAATGAPPLPEACLKVFPGKESEHPSDDQPRDLQIVHTISRESASKRLKLRRTIPIESGRHQALPARSLL